MSGLLRRGMKYRMGIRNSYKILIGKSEGETRPLKPRRRWFSTGSGQCALADCCEHGCPGPTSGWGGGGGGGVFFKKLQNQYFKKKLGVWF
jgi:hypothetical protein